MYCKMQGHRESNIFDSNTPSLQDLPSPAETRPKAHGKEEGQRKEQQRSTRWATSKGDAERCGTESCRGKQAINWLHSEQGMGYCIMGKRIVGDGVGDRVQWVTELGIGCSGRYVSDGVQGEMRFRLDRPGDVLTAESMDGWREASERRTRG
ncbi:hypothetical protein TIFTF001_029756 [Ficus carica]|uniref:Uncharacterized protein n=1 Tax=Ficus carica TaxID=3494 RepID=A0AA88J2U8_FICCA|nr:hypothetical protein TIFTF001_029756 [Ficus carica]